MKRGRRDCSESDSNDESSELDCGQQMIASHPWGLRPCGNLFHSLDNHDDEVDVRSSGLGNFCVLDDALVFLVLNLLSGRDLGRLSQSSRAFAVYCDHEPLWKDLLLKERKGDWKWRQNFRDTYVFEIYGAAAHRPFTVSGLYSDFLHKAWLCATAKFNRNWLGVDTVPKEKASELTMEDFVRKYEEPNRPVIIKGAIDNWPLYRNLSSWIEEQKQSVFKVGSVFMKLENFLEYSENALDEDPLYLFEKRCGKSIEGKYSVPQYFEKSRDLFNVLPEDQRPDYRWIIAGGACSGSPFHIGLKVQGSLLCFLS